MTIIILDLEWNTAYFSKESRFINEIIEFGAVKLDKNLDVVDDFQKFVRSRLKAFVHDLRHRFRAQLLHDRLVSDGEIRRQTERGEERTQAFVKKGVDGCDVRA